MTKKYKNVLEELNTWHIKYDFLKSQINSIEKLKDYPVFAISGFLLKSQLIEFELRQLIFKLDLHLNFSSKSQVVRKKILTPDKMTQWTMGDLRRKLLKYESKQLLTLQQKLKKLINLRNQFTHHLFDTGFDVKTLTEDAEKSTPLANQVLAEIEKVSKFLKNNDPLGNQ